MNKNNQQSGSFNSPSHTSSSTLHIDSDPAGINMDGSPYCSTGQLNKSTPYDCILTNNETETVITAPAEAFVSGQNYTFKTWEGCSESNSDKKICKIIFNQGDAKNLKAIFEKTTESQSLGAGDIHAPGSCRVASKYIIVGPQAFDDAKPAQLIVYNNKKDPYQPVNLQIWNGNSCIDVNSGRQLQAAGRAYRDETWGLTTSPHPKDVHAYIGLIDNSRTQQPIVITREDGKVMTDSTKLTKKFNAPSEDSWYFAAWTDNKTMLMHVGIEPAQHNNPNYPYEDTNPTNWFWYNVETDTFQNKTPTFPLAYFN